MISPSPEARLADINNFADLENYLLSGSYGNIEDSDAQGPPLSDMSIRLYMTLVFFTRRLCLLASSDS